MRALLLKELYTAKKLISVIIVGMLLSCEISWFFHDEKYIVGLLALFLASISDIIIFASDKSDWKKYSKVFPYTSAQTVSAKYIMSLIVLTAITSIYVLYRVIFINVTYSLYAYLLEEDALALFGAGLLSAGISLPLISKMGSIIGSLLAVSAKLSILIPSGIWMVFYLMMVEDSGYDYWLIVFAAVCFILFALSWLLSVKISEKENY